MKIRKGKGRLVLKAAQQTAVHWSPTNRNQKGGREERKASEAGVVRSFAAGVRSWARRPLEVKVLRA